MSPRRPEARRAARMAPLASLPLFLKLQGRRVILAGGDDPAVWKAELLAAAGAEVHLYATDIVDEMRALIADPPAGTIHWHQRPWSIDVFAGAAFAIGAIELQEEALAFRCAAKAAGVPVNIVDKPALCDVQFGAIVNRSPLIIGISTDGAAPVFGQAIRAKIEALLPQGLKRWAETAKRWRAAVTALDLPFAARRRFWELFTAQALANPQSLPDEALRDRYLAEAQTLATTPKGRIMLVGAGPGDPELLTLKALRALQAADVIVHDDLVSPEILEPARREAARISVGKRGHGRACAQDDINQLIVELGLSGKQVVRLKSGDPMIFGRAGEELAAARAAGIATEVIPGISSAQGAAASLQLSLTHRDYARRLQYVTGHARNGLLPDDFDWSAVADPAASTIVYMPRATWGAMATHLLARGVNPSTPALAVINATRTDEQVLHATVETLGDLLEAATDPGPVLVLYGEAFRSEQMMSEALNHAPSAFRPERAIATRP